MRVNDLGNCSSIDVSNGFSKKKRKLSVSGEIRSLKIVPQKSSELFVGNEIMKTVVNCSLYFSVIGPTLKHTNS